MSFDEKQLQKMSASKKYNRGMYNLSNATSQEDIDIAIMLLKAAAKQGEERADYILGKLYYEGKNVPQDYSKAVIYLRRAVQGGILEANYLIGLAYYYGNGIRTNYQKAFENFNKAISLTSPEVFHAIALCYEMGNGCTKSMKKAIEYYTEASDLGYIEARIKLADMYIKGTNIKRDYEKAFELLTGALVSGNDTVLLMLGLLYYQGNGTKKDLYSAFDCFESAYSKGNIEASFRLGLCYLEGSGVKENHKKAAELIIKAAEDNYVEAYFYAGMFYYEGKYKNNDLNMAQLYFKKSVQAGNEQAAAYLDKVKEDLAALQLELLEKEKNKEDESDAKKKAMQITRDYVYSVIDEEIKKAEQISKDINEFKEQFEKIIGKAKIGDSEAQFEVASSYYKGVMLHGSVVIPQNSEEAIHWFSILAKKGYEGAEEKLRECQETHSKFIAQKIIEDNLETQKRLKEKLDEEQRLAMQKKKNAQIAAMAAKNEFDSLVQFAKTGNPEALFYLGNAYFDGIVSGDITVVPVDLDKAIDSFTKSLNGGNQDAFKMLVKCQEIKTKLEKEKKERINALAMKNEFDALVQFAETGNADAQYYLATNYLEGLKCGEIVVVEPSKESAVYWLNEAADNGSAEALKLLENMEI